MKLRIVGVIFAIASLCLASAQEKQQKQTCTVTITDPHNGDSVQGDGPVTGTAIVPPGTHLWVFGHRRGLGLWWPEGGGSAQITDKGKWEVLVTYGIPRDVGSDFEVTTAVVADEDNNHLLTWVKKAEATGQYPGIRLPASVGGCPTPRVVVKRTE